MAAYEFNLFTLAASEVAGGVDPTLALMGSMGWEIRAMSAQPNGSLVIALQRALDHDNPLPDSLTLAAKLEEPLAAPSTVEFEESS